MIVYQNYNYLIEGGRGAFDEERYYDGQVSECGDGEQCTLGRRQVMAN